MLLTLNPNGHQPARVSVRFLWKIRNRELTLYRSHKVIHPVGGCAQIDEAIRQEPFLFSK